MRKCNYFFLFLCGAIIIIGILYSSNRSKEMNASLLKQLTEDAMLDAVDHQYYEEKGLLRIDRERFVESFVRRFADQVTLSETYTIEIYEIEEDVPQVSLKVKEKNNHKTSEIQKFTLRFYD